MASGVKQPPDKAARRYYKCHPKKQVLTVICLLCENAYHRSDFEKIPEYKYVGDNLIICLKHMLDDITSEVNDIELNDLAKKVIAIVKLKQTEEIRKELLQEIQNKTIEKHNLTVTEDERESEMDLFIVENTLLKKLVTELEDKNHVQKELIEKQKQKSTEIQLGKKSYADVTREIKTKNKRVPKITIKTKVPKQTLDT